jgi:hypothetical protein
VTWLSLSPSELIVGGGVWAMACLAAPVPLKASQSTQKTKRKLSNLFF